MEVCPNTGSVTVTKVIIMSHFNSQTGTVLNMGAAVYQERSVCLVVSSGGAPTPAGTSVFTKHNWDMGMGYLWLNGWGIYHLMGGAFMAYWVGHL